MTRKITTILLAMLLTALMAIGLCACATQEDIDNSVLPVEQQVTLINTTLDEMKATDKTLNDSITALTGRVTTLEGELETAKNNSGSVSTALTQEIADRKADIATLTTQDAALQAQITALETALADKEKGIKNWANGAFVSVTAWNKLKTQINTTIASLTSKIETLESSVGKINSTLTEMKATDTSLKNSIDGLTTRVTALETELVEVNAKITALQPDSATKTELENVKTSLQNQIDSLNAEITALKAKDEELQGEITALQTSLTDVEDWANNTFLSIANWTDLKADIEASIGNLTVKVDGLETSIENILSTLATMQNEINQNKQDIADLIIRVNCLEGKHVVDATAAITYTWSNDFSTCTASVTCKHCGAVSETATSTISGYTYTVSFTNKEFSSQTIDLTNLTDMDSTLQANALSVIFAAEPSTLTLTLPKDFDSFSLINDPIAEYDEGKYIDLTLMGVEKIPDWAFFCWDGSYSVDGNKKIKSVTLGDSVTSIGDDAFNACSALTSITLPESLTTIGDAAFSGSGLQSITIPARVASN